MIGAVVLAAGSSSRMGRLKALLTMGPEGKTFVDSILDTLQDVGVGAVRVVVAPGHQLPGRGGIVNPDPDAGMLSSLHCGLRAFREDLDAVLVWPVDHPLVKRDTVAAIIAAFRDGAPVIVPTHGGKRGHPVLFAKQLFPELLAADTGTGARAVVHAHDDRVELAVDDRGVVEDLDTPEDYARAFGSAIR